MQATYWLCAGFSLLATWWNVQRRRACFALWLLTNLVWAYAGFTHALPAKGWLHVAYAVLAIVGLVRWARQPEAAS